MIGPAGALPEYIQITPKGELIPHYKNDEYSGKAVQHDFWVEGTATTLIMETDLLLVEENMDEIRKYLPKIALSLDWLDSHRDPETGLLAVGTAGTLIERAYFGDGKGNPSCPSGTLAAYLKALANSIEVAKIVGDKELETIWSKRLQEGGKVFPKLLVDGRYLMSSLEPGGTRHGVIGAEKHNYFESNANCDAIAWDVADNKLADSILATIDSLPGLRPTPFIASVWPERDDMKPDAHEDEAYGPGAGYHWNGAAWYSSQGRFILALLKRNRFDDVFNILEHAFALYDTGTFRDVMADYGRLDPRTFNSDDGALYIDGFAFFAAELRGLFEYKYTADFLVVNPHIPFETTSYQQLSPIRFGSHDLYITIKGAGKKTIYATLNGAPLEIGTGNAVYVPRRPGWERLELVIQRG